MNDKLRIKILFAVIFLLCTPLQAEEEQLSKEIQAIIKSANDCEPLAYDVVLKNIDADEVFSGCVESRAILIAMQMRHGDGQYGEIDIFDKLEGYSHLTSSKNPRVQKEALSYSTAAGSGE